MTRLNTDLLIGLAALVITALAYFVTRDLSPLGGVFVNYVLVVLLTLSLACIVMGFVKPARREFFNSLVERNNILIGLMLLGLYLLLLPRVGFIISSYGFYFAISLYLSDSRLATGNLVKTAALSAIVVASFYFIFHGFLAVPLPPGTWVGE